jgi:hypothetical protein
VERGGFEVVGWLGVGGGEITSPLCFVVSCCGL